jgi:hypothetical protein
VSPRPAREDCAKQTLNGRVPQEPVQNSTTSFLTATTLMYANGAGITAAAGIRLALHFLPTGLESSPIPIVLVCLNTTSHCASFALSQNFTSRVSVAPMLLGGSRRYLIASNSSKRLISGNIFKECFRSRRQAQASPPRRFCLCEAASFQMSAMEYGRYGGGRGCPTVEGVPDFPNPASVSCTACSR